MAVVGIDGSGKSTVVADVVAGLAARGVPSESLYLGVSIASSDRALPWTRLAHRVKRSRGAAPDRHGPRRHEEVRSSSPRGARSNLRAALRLGNRLLEEGYRQSLARTARRRGRVIVFDRHWLADYHAYDVVGSDRSWDRRLHGFVLMRLLSKPDATVFLDAPAEVLLARKGEGDRQLLERRRNDYLALAGVLPRFSIVDATRPLPEVVAAVERVIDDVRVRQ